MGIDLVTGNGQVGNLSINKLIYRRRSLSESNHAENMPLLSVKDDGKIDNFNFGCNQIYLPKRTRASSVGECLLTLPLHYIRNESAYKKINEIVFTDITTNRMNKKIIISGEVGSGKKDLVNDWVIEYVKNKAAQNIEVFVEKFTMKEVKNNNIESYFDSIYEKIAKHFDIIEEKEVDFDRHGILIAIAKKIKKLKKELILIFDEINTEDFNKYHEPFDFDKIWINYCIILTSLTPGTVSNDFSHIALEGKMNLSQSISFFFQSVGLIFKNDSVAFLNHTSTDELREYLNRIPLNRGSIIKFVEKIDNFFDFFDIDHYDDENVKNALMLGVDSIIREEEFPIIMGEDKLFSPQGETVIAANINAIFYEFHEDSQRLMIACVSFLSKMCNEHVPIELFNKFVNHYVNNRLDSHHLIYKHTDVPSYINLDNEYVNKNFPEMLLKYLERKGFIAIENNSNKFIVSADLSKAVSNSNYRDIIEKAYDHVPSLLFVFENFYKPKKILIADQEDLLCLSKNFYNVFNGIPVDSIGDMQKIRIIEIMLDIAATLFLSHKIDEAKNYLENACIIMNKAFDKGSHKKDYNYSDKLKFLWVRSHVIRAGICDFSYDFPSAIKEHNEAQDYLLDSLDPIEKIQYLNYKGLSLRNSGNIDEAIIIFDKAKALYEEWINKNKNNEDLTVINIHHAITLLFQSICYRDNDELDCAIARNYTAIKILESENISPSSPLLGLCNYNFGLTWNLSDNKPEGLKCFLKSQFIFEKFYKGDHFYYVKSLEKIAESHFDSQNLPQAREFIKLALQYYEEKFKVKKIALDLGNLDGKNFRFISGYSSVLHLSFKINNNQEHLVKAAKFQKTLLCKMKTHCSSAPKKHFSEAVKLLKIQLTQMQQLPLSSTEAYEHLVGDMQETMRGINIANTGHLKKEFLKICEEKQKLMQRRQASSTQMVLLRQIESGTPNASCFSLLSRNSMERHVSHIGTSFERRITK